MKHRAVLSLAALGLLAGCANPRVTAYKNDHKAFLDELVYCQNHYAQMKDNPDCKAAFRVNSQLFPE